MTYTSTIKLNVLGETIGRKRKPHCNHFSVSSISFLNVETKTQIQKITSSYAM